MRNVQRPFVQQAWLGSKTSGSLARAPSMPALTGSTELSSRSSVQGCGAGDSRYFEDKLRSLATRQDGFERRLVELGGLQDDLGDFRCWAQGRLDDVEDIQRTTAIDLKVVSAMADEIFRNQFQRGGSPSRDLAVPAHGNSGDQISHRRLDEVAASQIAELRHRADVHGQRLRVLAAAAGRCCLQRAPRVLGSDEPTLLRTVLHEWRAALCRSDFVRPRTSRLGDRSVDAAVFKELRRSVGTSAVRIDEQDRRLEDLRDLAQKQELHLAKVDAELGIVLSNSKARHTSPPVNDGLLSHIPGAVGRQLAELLETLTGQAQAVEDLEVIVRDELQASRELAEAAAANVASDPKLGSLTKQLLERVSEQGQAIEQLRDLLAELRVELLPRAERQGIAEMPSEKTPELAGRVAELEGDVASMQEHLGALVAVVRYIRDHASDALEDRVAVAMNEVHRRVAGSIASMHERVDCLRPGPTTSPGVHRPNMEDPRVRKAEARGCDPTSLPHLSTELSPVLASDERQSSPS